MPWLIVFLVVGLLLIAAIWATFSLLGVIVTVIVAALVGALADWIVPGDIPYGWLGAIVAGLAGSWLGSMIFGQAGPVVGGIPIVPAVIGAIVLAVLLELITGRGPRHQRPA